MPLDPSISQGITPPPNPLAIAGQAAQLQNHLNQSALFNLNTQSQLAVGHVLQQSIGDDGEIDFTKALTLSKENPLAAYGMPAALSQNLQRQLTQGQIAEKYLKISHDALDVQNGYIAALQGKEGGGSDQEVNNAFDTAWKLVQDNPAIPEKLKQSMRTQAIANRADLPQQGDGRVAWVKEHAQRAMDAKTRLDALTGHIGTLDIGSKQYLYRYDAQDGKTKIIGAADKGVSPETASTLTPDGPGGKMLPRAQVAPLVTGGGFQGSTGFGNGLSSNQGGAQPAPAGQPAPDAQPAPGAQPPLSPAQWTPPPGGALGPQPKPSLITGGSTPQNNLLSGPLHMSGPASTATSLTEKENITNLSKVGSDYVENLQNRVNAGGDIMQRLKEVAPLLDQMKTGGYQWIWSKIADVAQGLGMSNSTVDAINRGDRSATAEFEKLMVHNATTQMTQAFGGQAGTKASDLRFESFQKSNPNIDTDPDAVKKIMNFMGKVYERDLSEQDAYIKASKQPGFDLRDWPNKWQHMQIDKGIIDQPGTRQAIPDRYPPGPRKAGDTRPSLDSIIHGH